VQELSPQPGSAANLGRIHLRRGTAARAHRRRELHAERRWLLDADPQRSAATRSEIFLGPVSAGEIVRPARLNRYAAVAAGSGSSAGGAAVPCRNRCSSSAAGSGGEK